MLHLPRSLVLALGLAMFPVPALSQQVVDFPREQASDLVGVSPEDRAMNTAMADARRSLPVFWSLMEEYPEYIGAFSIKVGLPTNEGALEHIWVYDLSVDGEMISGKLENQPFGLAGGLKQHAPVTFKAEDVSDWVIWFEDKRYGGYTIRVIAELTGGDEGTRILEQLHEDPIPPFAEQSI